MTTDIWLPDDPAPPVLEGPRVCLRPIREGDEDAVFDVFGDAAVMRYWSRPPMRSPEEARGYVADLARVFARRTHLPWAITLIDDDLLLGTCTLFAISLAHRRAEIGYALAKSHWRRGIAREALTIALAYAFDVLGLNRVEADTDPRNTRSIRMLETLGFRREGVLRERWLVNAESQDSALYGLLAREWRALRA